MTRQKVTGADKDNLDIPRLIPVTNLSLGCLIAKYLVIRDIDYNWGNGDAHLRNLEAILLADPNDIIVKTLYEKLKKKSEYWKAEYAKPEKIKEHEQHVKEYREKYYSRYDATLQDYYLENVYRDAGKDEADAILGLIEKQHGKDVRDKVEAIDL